MGLSASPAEPHLSWKKSTPYLNGSLTSHQYQYSPPIIAPVSLCKIIQDRKILIMNGTNGVAAPPGLWSEARNAEGRVYYYNTVTKATQWTKPTDLMTPAEVP